MPVVATYQPGGLQFMDVRFVSPCTPADAHTAYVEVTNAYKIGCDRILVDFLNADNTQMMGQMAEMSGLRSITPRGTRTALVLAHDHSDVHHRTSINWSNHERPTRTFGARDEAIAWLFSDPKESA